MPAAHTGFLSRARGVPIHALYQQATRRNQRLVFTGKLHCSPLHTIQPPANCCHSARRFVYTAVLLHTSNTGFFVYRGPCYGAKLLRRVLLISSHYCFLKRADLYHFLSRTHGGTLQNKGGMLNTDFLQVILWGALSPCYAPWTCCMAGGLEPVPSWHVWALQLLQWAMQH